MNKDVYDYFLEQYEKVPFKVVPGHWPDFKSKEHVDRWISLLNTMYEYAENEIED